MSADKPIKRRIRKPAGKAPRPAGSRGARPGEATGGRKPGGKGKGPNFAKPPRGKPAGKGARPDGAGRRGQRNENRDERADDRRDARRDGGRAEKRPASKFVRRERAPGAPERKWRDEGDRRPQTGQRDEKRGERRESGRGERRDGGRDEKRPASKFVRRERAPGAPERQWRDEGDRRPQTGQRDEKRGERRDDRRDERRDGGRDEKRPASKFVRRQRADDQKPAGTAHRAERPQRDGRAQSQREDRPRHEAARPQSDDRPQRDVRPQREGRSLSARPQSDRPNRPARPASGARKPLSPAIRRQAAAEAELPALNPDGPVRIAKAMARAGLCSRRDAERWIEEGRVSVNGRVLSTPAFEIGPKDKVLVDGQPLPAVEPPQLWRYYKPRGLVTTHADPQGRPTVFDSLPEELPRVVSIGRLDFNSEGLLLLTNDGRLARYMELPSTGWLRRYRARAHGRVTQDLLDRLKDGVEIEGVRYGPVEAAVDSVQGANTWLTVSIREGKNREVRRILAHLGLEVNRLIRISYGPFQLLDLKPGEAEVVRRRVLADQLGPRLAEQFDLGKPADPEREKRQARNKKAD
ncbi:pseudouridine synthase [Hyphomicrobium sulfonivorans]|uniref:pseudouridine synthase n=1 Tax=Hyphomicrobium sulfonivorans TaxID=121290 RepID=UPI00156D830B|nr:pseudouridine synthase [Hyphomicrobium sulfonivorans]MBI1651121.1 pseudouridine synthase [Hyphomicrobium sulfonivorans]